MKLKLKYLFLGTALSTQILFMKLAQAAEWTYVECSNIQVVNGSTLPKYLAGLHSFYWGISVEDEKTTRTNLGIININFDNTEDKMIYPMKGTTTDKQTKFTINLPGKNGDYRIDFATDFNDVLADKTITLHNYAMLSGCKNIDCRCKGENYTPPTQHDPEEISTTTGVCSCTLL